MSDNNGKALAVLQNDVAIMPVMDIAQAVRRYEQFKEFVGRILGEGVDFGVIPGTTQKTLLLPGAEKLSTFFGLLPKFQIIEKIEDWTGKDHGGEPFFYYLYRCSLYRGDHLIAESDGSCNSWEVKYRYRNANRICPTCGSDTIIKGKEEYGGGWLCFAKKGGCGAKFRDGDESIEGQKTGRVLNDAIADQVNTFQKIAQKRSFVGTVKIATNASDYFTQDMEDFTNVPIKTTDDIVDGEFTEQTQSQPPKPKPQPVAQKPQRLTGFPAIVSDVNKELGLEHYTIPHAQNVCKKLIDDFKMPGPNDTEALVGVKSILLDHANAPKSDTTITENEIPF